MWKCLILLVVGLITAACGAGPSDVTGPPTDGTLVISTATGGDDPDQDGYLLMVDDFTSLTLHPTGTAEVDVPTGHHRLRLLGVAEQCSVVPDTSLQTVVPLRDTVEVHFSVTCEVPQGPPPQKSFGAVRISAPTTGGILSSARYEVSYEHYGAWDYGGGTLTSLGVLGPNDTLVAELSASTASGADPYWYEFHLKGIPANCRAQGQPPVAITAGDTLNVEFTVGCSP